MKQFMNLFPGVTVEPIKWTGTPIICILGVLNNDRGKVIKQEMLSWITHKYDCIAVNQEPPGRLFEYPALFIAQQTSISTGKPVLYLHTKGAANPTNVYHQDKVRKLWYNEFIDNYTWYSNYIKNHPKDVVCPFSGINQDTWMNGFIATPYAWKYAPCRPSEDRYIYECMWRGTNIHTEGRIRNDVHEYPSTSSLFMCDYINNDMYCTTSNIKKLELYVAGTDTDKFKHFESIRIPYYVNRYHTNTNIDSMNKWYCELTALFYMWKNSSADIVGLEHYRTYFTRNDDLLDETSIRNILTTNNIIVGRMHYPTTMGLQSIRCGSMSEFAPTKPYLPLFENIVTDYDSDLGKVFQAYLDNEYLIPTNTFITSKPICDEYCSVLFTLLNRFMEIVGCNEKTSRIAGYMGELFLGAYIQWAGLIPYYSNMTKFNKDLTGVLYNI